jgi:hypothetical protein
VESIELSPDRHLFVLADNYHKGIRGNQAVEGEGKAGDSEVSHLESVVEWYRRHTQEIGFKKIKFSILTANE